MLEVEVREETVGTRGATSNSASGTSAGVLTSSDLCATGSASARLEGNGESGTKSWLVLIEATIFSRSIGEMCGCFRERLSVESLSRSSGRARLGHNLVAWFSPSSEDTESMLEESGGAVERAEEDVVCLCLSERGGVNASGAQQKDSREKRRQLRFSNRFPSSIA